jgi:hypothetical protein
MMKRPTSVSVIAWFLIVTAVLTGLSSIYAMNDPLTQSLMAKSVLPVSVQYVLMYVGLAITLAAATAMLKGKHWGRLLYLGWGVVGLVIGALTSPMKAALIPGAVMLIIFGFFLFRPKATAYFNQRVAANDALVLRHRLPGDRRRVPQRGVLVRQRGVGPPHAGFHVDGLGSAGIGGAAHRYRVHGLAALAAGHRRGIAFGRRSCRVYHLVDGLLFDG